MSFLEDLSQQFCVNKNTKKQSEISKTIYRLLKISKEPFLPVQAGHGLN